MKEGEQLDLPTLYSNNINLMPKEFAPFRVFFNNLRATHIRPGAPFSQSLENTLRDSPNAALIEPCYRFPPTKSPVSGKILKWRLINLQAGNKNNRDDEYVEDQYKEMLDDILKALPMIYWVPTWVCFLFPVRVLSSGNLILMSHPTMQWFPQRD